MSKLTLPLEIYELVAQFLLAGLPAQLSRNRMHSDA